jgi:hypothetical protein
MTDLQFPEAANVGAQQAALNLAPAETCDECIGAGGWYRYEPSLEPTGGMLYLSCLHCRGNGRLALARA